MKAIVLISVGPLQSLSFPGVFYHNSIVPINGECFILLLSREYLGSQFERELRNNKSE